MGTGIDATLRRPRPLGASPIVPSEPTPTDIEIERESAVTITWRDGHRTRVPVSILRDRCPCAGCVHLRRTGDPVWSGHAEGLVVTGAELVGGWGLGLAWSDGHATGVYPWAMLRSWCACDDCRDRDAG